MIKQIIHIILIGIFVIGCSFPGIQDDVERTKTEGEATGAVVGAAVGAAIEETQKDKDPEDGAATGALVGAVLGHLYARYVNSQKAPLQAQEASLDEQIQKAQETYQLLVEYNRSLTERLTAIDEETRQQIVLYNQQQLELNELTKEQQELHQAFLEADEQLQQALNELAVLKKAYQKEQSVEGKAKLQQQIALLEQGADKLYQTLQKFLI
jgi:DNA repair exonuclease SbcCD ATPase subunit